MERAASSLRAGARPPDLGLAPRGLVWGGGAPPAYIEVASEIGPTRVFSLSPLPHCEMCNKPSGATRVKINLLASLKFKIIHQISAVILRQVARVGHMLSHFLA